VSDRPLREAFRELLLRRRLMVVPWEDVLLATSLYEGRSGTSVQFYDIAPLLPANRRGYFHAHQADADDVLDLVTSIIAPNTWDDVGGEGSVTVVRNALVVWQTEEVQASIRQLLADLMSIPDLPEEFGICSTSRLASSEASCAWDPEEESLLTTRIYQLGPSAANLPRWPLQSTFHDPPTTTEPGTSLLSLVAFIEKQSQIVTRLRAETDDADSTSVTWANEAGDRGVQVLIVEDRPVVVVHQSSAGHERVERMLRAVIASRSDRSPSPLWQDGHGWRVLSMSAPGAAERGLLVHDAKPQLDWLWQLEAKEHRNPYLRTEPTTLLWQFLIENLPQKDQQQRTYVWDDQVLVIVDDLAQADSARQVTEALLTALDQVHAEMVADDDAPPTLSQQTDRLLEILLSDEDPARRQSAVLLLGAHAASSRPLSAAQAEQLAQWPVDIGRPLEWQTFLMAGTACRPHGAALLEPIERMLPHLSNAQTADMFDLLGTIGPQAVPLLCRITITDVHRRPLLRSSLKQAADGDPQAIATIIYTLTGSDDLEILEMISLLREIDPDFATTRQVFLGAPPAGGAVGAQRWQKLRELVEAQIGDPFP
jgi:hypothetical protein